MTQRQVRRRSADTFEYDCPECGFHLFNGIVRMSAGDLALVDDARYPGRCMLSLRGHAEHCDELSAAQFGQFCRDAQRAAAAIRAATECDRMNVFLLGNRTSHLHFHIVPRVLVGATANYATPFEDPNEVTSMGHARFRALAASIQERLTDSPSRRSSSAHHIA